MKLLLVFLILIVGWKAGYVLLMAGFLAGFYLVHDGTKKLMDGDFAGRQRISIGTTLGVGSAVLLVIFTFALVLLSFASLAALFPAVVTYAESVLFWFTSF